MTEAEWLDCSEPRRMLTFLASRGHTSERKMRLFACACFRRSWQDSSEEHGQSALDVAERYADGMADDEEREGALRAAASSARFGPGAVRRAVVTVARTGAMVAAASAGQLAAIRSETTWSPEFWEKESRRHSSLVRDLFGLLPFRSARAIDPAWRGGTVPQLARAVYEKRRLPEVTLEPARLAVLGDALEDVGCTDAELLGHLRGPGPHVRGCWALDLILSKE